MNIVAIDTKKEIFNALTHFREWTTITRIARTIRLNPGTVEKLCWDLTGRGVLVWRPGTGRGQLFRYAPEYMKKKETQLLPEIKRILGRDYYITGRTGLFLHGMTEYGMFQRKTEISLPRERYKDLVAGLVKNLNKYTTILPHELPKRCNREEIFADALERGNVIVVHKAAYNVRKLRFHGEHNLPNIDIILAETDLNEKELFEYAFKAMDMGMTRESLDKLCRTRKVLTCLGDYLDKKEIPKESLKKILEAEKSARGY